MWHNRPVLSTFMTAGRKAQKWAQLDANLKSFAHMAVASLVGCSFCLDLGYFQAHNEGLDEAKASEVPRWRESTVFTSLERDVMEYAEAMSATPPTVTDEQSARLLLQLGAPAMVELTAWVAFANLVTRCNNAMGIESQGFSEVCSVPLARPTAGIATPA
jgi:AhpD family alkylhydroperoxidase